MVQKRTFVISFDFGNFTFLASPYAQISIDGVIPTLAILLKSILRKSPLNDG